MVWPWVSGGSQMVWSWVSGKFGMGHRGFTVVEVLFFCFCFCFFLFFVFFFCLQWWWQRLIFVRFGCRLLGLLDVFLFFIFYLFIYLDVVFGGLIWRDVVLGGRFWVCRIYYLIGFLILF